MAWIVLTVLFGLAFWGAIIYWASYHPSDPNAMPRGVPFVAACLVAIVWVLISTGMSVHNVGQREVAIVYNFSGTIAGKRDPGVVWTAPWQHVKKENVGILHDDFIFDEANAAVSLDQQKIISKISVNYQIEPENIVDLYKRVGPAWKDIIVDARVPQVFKETTATFTTPELTQKRAQLRIDTKDRLIAELASYDIKVVDVFIRNLSFSQEYTASIERKQKQAQDSLTAAAKVDQVKAEAKQKVAEAEGIAAANVAEARGEATANKLRQKSLTPLLVQLEAIDKLNPGVTTIICAEKIVCIPNGGTLPSVVTPAP